MSSLFGRCERGGGVSGAQGVASAKPEAKASFLHTRRGMKLGKCLLWVGNHLLHPLSFFFTRVRRIV